VEIGTPELVRGGDWNETQSAYNATTWDPKPFEPAPPQAFVDLLGASRDEIMAAVDLNSALFSAALRESWKLCFSGSSPQLGELVKHELKSKIDPDVSLSWTDLRASDLSGRARAFQSLVGGVAWHWRGQ
jgi:inactivated superfamily I helicase